MRKATMHTKSVMARIGLGVIFAGITSIASAALLTPSALDPTGTTALASGGYTEQACPTPQSCPTAGHTITGMTDVFFNIVHASGIANVSLLGNTTPFNSGFFTFIYSVMDLTAGTVVSTGGPPQLPPDFAVTVNHSYEIIMSWTLHATSAMDSANWGLNVTTGPRTGQTPEPATLALLGIGLAGLGFASRRKKG